MSQELFIILLSVIVVIPAAFINLAATVAAATVPTGFQTIYATSKIFPSLPQNSTVQGTATYVDNGALTIINVYLTGLTPGLHGIHIHEYGDFSKDCADWGAHFDDTAAPENHGEPNSTQHHKGDLGNLVADATGYSNFSITVDYETTLHHYKTETLELKWLVVL